MSVQILPESVVVLVVLKLAEHGNDSEGESQKDKIVIQVYVLLGLFGMLPAGLPAENLGGVERPHEEVLFRRQVEHVVFLSVVLQLHGGFPPRVPRGWRQGLLRLRGCVDIVRFLREHSIQGAPHTHSAVLHFAAEVEHCFFII